MKEIGLSKGYVALVDDEDFGWLSQWKWHVADYGSCVYAKHTVKNSSGFHSLWMHRLILEAPPNMQVDHIDGCGWNNQKKNLRLCTARENSYNKSSIKGSSSDFVGIYLNKSSRKTNSEVPSPCNWRADISVGGKKIHLGYFKTEEEAAEARDIASLRLYGEFAKLNFPEKIN